MKKVYTRENRFEVSAMRAFLESHGVPSLLKNEFTSAVMGEVPFFETWPEIWVSDDLFERAQKLVTQAQMAPINGADWVCDHCQEHNPGTFELCWSCSKPA